MYGEKSQTACTAGLTGKLEKGNSQVFRLVYLNGKIVEATKERKDGDEER